MGLSDLYYKLEEKYYASLDWFDSKGVHFFYKIDEWLQSKNIPSFPVVAIFNLVLLVAIILLVLFFAGVFGTSYVNTTLQFVDVTNNASVTGLPVLLTFENGTEEGITNDAGELEVSLPQDAYVQVSIDSEKYMLTKTSFSAVDDSVLLELTDKSNLLGNKILKLFSDFDSKVLFSGVVEVDLTCSDNSDYIKKKTVVDGVLDLDDLPENCGNLMITSYDPEISKSVAVTKNSLELLIDAEQKTGTMRVIVQNDENKALSNISVSVYSQDDVLKVSQITQETGLVELLLPVGKYYVSVADSGSGDYTFASTKNLESTCNSQIVEDVALNCSITMQKLNIGKINLKIVDVSNKPVATANVKVYKGELELFNDTLQQDSNGLFVRGVAEQGPYRVVIDSPQYMIYDNSNVMISATPMTISLEPVKSSPVLSILVTANGDVVANATVQLFKEGNLLLTKTTGANGIAFFDRLESGKVYNAKVTKGEYTQTSQTITLDARAQNQLEVKMVIGKGNVDVLVLNKNNEPILANVDLLSVYDDRVLGAPNQTDNSGTAHFYGISADKTVYARITTEKGISYSLVSDVLAGQTVTLKAYAIDESTTLNMELVGVFNNDGSEISTLPYSVVPNGEYYALFLLQVPKGKAYSSGNVFFIGDAKTQADTSILIKNTEVLFGQETKGLTYNAPIGYAEDMLNKTSDSSLWSSVNLSKVNAGSSLVKVSFLISGEPKTDLFKLGYRANLKSGTSYIRYPVDNILGQNESTSDKLGFYAETNGLSFRSGDAICSNVACIELSAQDSTGYKTKLGQDAVLYSQFNTDTVLGFKIVSATKTTLNNLTLKVESKNLGLNISNVSVNGKELQGKGKYSTNIDSFNSGKSISGNVGFTTNKEGDTLLTISLESEKEVLFSKEIKVSVNSANNLVVEYLPTIIVPYVLNLGAVVVTDSTEKLPVSDILVNVYLNDVLLTSGKTDGEGKLPVQIDKPNSGDVLKLVASGAGYNPNTTTIKITENILMPSKPEIVINIDKTEKEIVSTSILLKTTLPYKLKVKKVGFSTSDFTEFLDVKTNSIVNKEFDGNLDVNVVAQLTDLGKALLEPKSFKTNLELVISSDDLDKQWVVQIPLELYIRMYDSLDALNCLQLNSDSNGTSSFKIVNNCMYKNSPTLLYKPTVYVEWDGTPLGEYVFNKEKISDEGLMLYKELKPKTTTFKLNFVNNPAVASGQSKLNVILKAYFPTENGLQEITASKENVVTVSDLTKCLLVIDPTGKPLTAENASMTAITLGVAQMGMGMGMLNGMYNPMLGALSGTNGFAMGTAGMFGGGATYFQPGNFGSFNSYDSVLRTTSMQDPSVFWGGMNSNATGIPGFGTSESPNMNTGYAPGYAPNMNNGYNSGYGPNNNSGYQAPFSRNVGNSFDALNNMNRAYNSEDSFDTEDKILFDVYPYSPMNMGMNYGMNSMYGMGMFGAMMQNMYLPPINKIQFRNTCNEAVDLEVRAMPQILISPNTITLAPRQTKEINVMSTSLPGTYTMNVLAGTNGNILPLMTIPVNVIDYASNTATDDCFKLSDEPVINMSDVWKRNKLIKVYNYCYSKGVIFDDAQPIALRNLFSRQPVVAKSKVGDLNDIRIEQNTAYVSAVALGVPTVQTSATYGQYQELTVMLEKDPSIQRLVKENLSRNNSLGDWVGTLSSVRSSLADIYNNVEFPAIFVINARIGFGQTGMKRSIQRLVTVRDMWNLLGGVDLYENLMGGDRSCGPNKDTNKIKSWDSSIKKDASYTLKCEDLKKSEIRVPYTDAFTLLGKPCFGKADGVKFKTSKITVEKEGIKLEVTPYFDSGNIYFTVVPKSAIPKGTNKTIDVLVDYKLESYYHSDAGYEALHRKFNLKLDLDVDCDISGSSSSSTSTSTLSGTDKWCTDNFGANWYSLEHYGFGDYNGLTSNMLTYNYPNSSATAKDCTKYFCDAEQLKLNLQSRFTGTGIILPSSYNTISVLSKDIVVRKGCTPTTDENCPLELGASKVLDPLSIYFMDRDLRRYVVGPSGLSEFTKLVENMPDMYLKVTGNCNARAKDQVAFEDHNNCYYNAKMLTGFPNAESVLRTDLNRSFNVVFLVDTKTFGGMVLYHPDFSRQGKISNVYLKPDDYNAVFNNNSFLSYTAELMGTTKMVTANEAGVYAAMTFDASGKKLIWNKANYYLGSSADKTKTVDKLFYNLPVDAKTPSTGEYGLCVSGIALKVDGETLNPKDCASVKFAKANVENYTENFLTIANTDDLKDLIIKYPTCDKSGCVVNAGSKRITVPKEGYLLSSIFNKSNEYCYKEDTDEINIKYSGVKN